MGRLLAPVTAVIVSIGLAGCNGGAAQQVDTSIATEPSEPKAVTTSSSLAADESSGDAATWTIDPGEAVTATTTSFAVLVTRLGCADGVTGEVLEPVIVTEADQVVITFSVDPLDPTLAYTCPTNDANTVVVHLDGPLGHRSLVDGACLGQSPATDTSFCETGAVRLKAPS
ncbi:MAG: hypothetical protein U0Q03_20520 [Acidimicrobiales bacterium]